MRTLCLNLHQQESASVAENFLVFSPRVHFRDPGLIFLDVTSTSHIFGGEQKLLAEAVSLSKEFFPGTTAAIADTPFAAQVFSNEYEGHIIPPTHESNEIAKLPLTALNHLEGLFAWRSYNEIDDLVQFFMILGMKCIGEIQGFEVESFRERWKNTGSTLWKRLHGLDKQVISPLEPSVALEDYIHLDFSISLTSFLLHCIEKSLKQLFSRLQGRGEFAQKIVLQLHCEYSNQTHLVQLSPASPNRDLELFLKLLENKIETVDLSNPIKEVEISILTCPEKTEQLDFWQPRISDTKKLQQLVSILGQAELSTGFFTPNDEILPEDSWAVSSEYQFYEPIDDVVNIDGNAYQIHPSYSKALKSAPRPSRILKSPLPLTKRQFQRLHILSVNPLERIEEGWWEESRGRDYYIALTTQGQCLWVYRDLIEDRYFIHGYFD